MKEGDEFVGGAFEGDFVDQTDATLGGLAELAGDVVCAESDVVDALTIFLEELGNRAFFGGRLEQFEMNAATVKEGGADFLGLDFLAAVAVQAEGVLIVLAGFVQVADGDAEVVDLLDHGSNQSMVDKNISIRKPASVAVPPSPRSALAGSAPPMVVPFLRRFTSPRLPRP